MSLYPLVPLIACLVSAILATAILSRDARRRANRLAAALVSGASFWAFCEVMWHGQDHAPTALALVKLSALGWAWMAPLALDLFLELSGEPCPRLRRLARAGYAASAGMVLLTWATPWVHRGVVRTDWGWAYSFGPAYPFFYAYMIGFLSVALWIGWRAVSRSGSPAERAQARWVSLAILVPLVVASLTDGLLPLAGMQVPRFGTASFAVLGGVILWTFQRYGYSILAPGTFADQILETLPDGVALLGMDGRIRTANGALARMLELPTEELRGLPMRERLSAALAPGAGVAERECELRTASGRQLPVAIATTRLRDRLGAEIGVVLVVRSLDEVVALRDRLQLSGRLAAVGELAAGIAHEINNPLAFTRANLGLLRQHWSALESMLEKGEADSPTGAVLLAEGEELLDESLEGVDRAIAIVRDVKGLAHGGSRQRQEADLVELLEGVLRIAGPQLRGRATVERDLRPQPRVWGAPQELQQVFLNLVLNAAQSLDERGGTIRVETASEDGFVVVRVRDDGCGIAPEIRDRIFDPFFTTKSVGEGTGLGLGIAYGIVRSHGGEILVESEPGRGSCFSVHLPVAADTLAAS